MTASGPGDDPADTDRGQPRKYRFLVRTAAALFSTSVITAGLGFVYWAVAARMFPASDVGESATAIAVMSLIAPFTILGFGTMLTVQLPRMRHGRTRLLSAAALISGLTGGVVALVCALVLPSDFLGVPGVGSDIGVTTIFMAAVATQGVGLLLDQALLSLLGGGAQLGRNAIHASVKLVVLVILALTLNQYGALDILASWLVANVVSIAVVAIVLFRRHEIPLSESAPAPSNLLGLRLDAAKHHALNIALFVPYFAMPIVANVTLGSEQAGYFFVSWSVAGFVFFLPAALATALFASGARDKSRFLEEFRFTLRWALAICAVANLVILLLGGVVLHIFGAEYAANGRLALIVICLGGFGLIVKDHHVAFARTVGTVGREAVLIGGLSVGQLAGATIGATQGGILGLSLGWLAAVGLEFMVCGPLVWQVYRGRVPVPTTRPGENRTRPRTRQ